MIDLVRRQSWVTTISAAMLCAGGIAWVFPGRVIGAAPGWILPLLAVGMAVMAVLLAGGQRTLQALLAGVAAAALVGWLPSSGPSTAHLLGICVGMLTMMLLAQSLDDLGRLRWGVVGFLMIGTAVVMVSVAALPVWRHDHAWPVILASMMDIELPVLVGRIPLALAGVDPVGVNPNAVAGVSLMVMPFAAALVFRPWEQATASWALFLAAVLALVTSVVVFAVASSRMGSAAAWFAGVILVARVCRPGAVRVVLAVTAMLPLVGLVFATTMVSQDTFRRGADSMWESVNLRKAIVSEGIAVWQQRPWLGIGLSQFRGVASPDATGARPAHAHNIVVQTLLDIGLLGSVAFWGLCVLVLSRAERATRRGPPIAAAIALGAITSLMAIGFFGLGDAVALGAKIGLLQWMVAGLALAAARVSTA